MQATKCGRNYKRDEVLLLRLLWEETTNVCGVSRTLIKYGAIHNVGSYDFHAMVDKRRTVLQQKMITWNILKRTYFNHFISLMLRSLFQAGHLKSRWDHWTLSQVTKENIQNQSNRKCCFFVSLGHMLSYASSTVKSTCIAFFVDWFVSIHTLWRGKDISLYKILPL